MRIILGLWIVLFIVSCNCRDEVIPEFEYECSGIAIIDDEEDLSDSIWIVLPNIILADEIDFNFVYIDHAFEIEDVEIESYSFELRLGTDFYFQTVDPLFISQSDRLSIPKDSIFNQVEMPLGNATYTMHLRFKGYQGEIVVSHGEVLMSDCATISAFKVDVKDCRYSYSLIPPPFDEPPGFLCM